MERRPPHYVSPAAAREQLEAARRVRKVSVRRAASPPGLIVCVSFLCGAMTLARAHQPLGSAVMIAAVLWFVAELLTLSARNGWEALRSLPRPRWNPAEAALTWAALLLGGLVGPHVLASPSNSGFGSWLLAGGVAATVAVLLFAANASYRRRSC